MRNATATDEAAPAGTAGGEPRPTPPSRTDGSQAVTVRPLLLGEDASSFRRLNEEWITRYFVLEPKDRETLRDPEHTILRRGGHILQMHRGEEVVGCVALIPMGNGVFELSKMAIDPECRGAGLGRRLLQHAINHALTTGATSLFLGSNRILADAVHLYESVGFHHVPPERLPPMHYSRANVFMELIL